MPHQWFWRLIWSALTRQAKSRTVLLAAALGTAVAVALLGVHVQMGGSLSRELRAYGANLTVTAAPEHQGLDQRRLTESLHAVDGVERIGTAPYVQALVAMGRPMGARTATDAQALLVGADLAELAKVKPYLMVDGRWPAKPDEALVGVEEAGALHLEVGEAVVIQQTGGRELRLTVSGLVISGGEEDDQVLVPLATAQAFLGRPGEVDGALLSLVAGGQELERLAGDIARVYPASVATPRAQVARSEAKVQTSLLRLFLLVTLVTVLATLLCVCTTMVAMVGQRHQEIGLKRALGAPARLVRREFLVEAAVLGVAGGVVGTVAGWGLAGAVGQLAFGVPVTPPWVVIPLALVATPVVTVLAASWPVHQVTGFRPITALRGDSA